MASRRSVTKAATPEPDPRQLELAFTELGAHGLDFYGGKVDDEWLSDLRGTKAAKVYREMADNDPILGSTWWVTSSLLARTPVRFKAAEHPEGEAVKAFAEECWGDLLEDGGQQTVTQEMLTCTFYGYSVLEKVYKLRQGLGAPLDQARSKFSDNRVGWRKFPMRAQESVEDWRFGSNGETLGLWQDPPHDHRRRYIPREKLLHFRVRALRGSPEGQSLYRQAYTSYFLKKKLQFFEAVSNERYGAGYPVAKAPLRMFAKDASVADKATLAMLKEVVKNIRRDAYMGVVFPSGTGPDGQPTGFELDFLSGGGSRPADYDVVIKRYDQRIAMTQLTQFLLLGADKVGSFALSSDQTDLFAVGLGVLLDIRDEQFNTDALPELAWLNGWPPEAAPTMEHGDLEKPDLAKLAGLFSAAIGGGMTLDKETEDWVRDLMGAPPSPGLAGMGGAEGAPALGASEPTAALGPPAEALPAEAAKSAEWLTMGEAAAFARVSPSTVANWIRSGAMPAGRTPGGRWLVDRSVLEQTIQGAIEESNEDAQVPYA